MKKRIILYASFLLILSSAVHVLKAQTPKEKLYLETIANVVGHDLYISYVYLGSLTDSYIYKVYAQKFALNLLNEYVDYINIIKAQMIKVNDNKLVPPADTNYVKLQIDAYETLRLEALEFIKYVETGESKYVESYENLRRKAWTQIATILGIPEEIEKVYKD